MKFFRIFTTYRQNYNLLEKYYLVRFPMLIICTPSNDVIPTVRNKFQDYDPKKYGIWPRFQTLFQPDTQLSHVFTTYFITLGSSSASKSQVQLLSHTQYQNLICEKAFELATDPNAIAPAPGYDKGHTVRSSSDKRPHLVMSKK